MDIEVGNILSGKVAAIVKFGAFVEIAPGKTGLVHISEIANSYVNDVSEHLTVGQEVTVKVIGTESGKLNLSIKQTAAPRPPEPAMARAPSGGVKSAPDNSSAFEDKLRRFMQDSDIKMSGVRGYNDKKGKRRGK